MHPEALGALQSSAALELSQTSQDYSLAAGVIVLIIGWVCHHEAAHRHNYLDLAAKALLIAGSVLLFTGVDSLAHLLESVNGWSANLLAGIIHWVAPHAPWPPSLGVLTLLEFVILPVLCFIVWDQLRNKSGRAAGRGVLFPKLWKALRDKHVDRWGWVAAGPLTVTLPLGIGPMCALPFTALAAVIGHPVAMFLAGK